MAASSPASPIGMATSGFKVTPEDIAAAATYVDSRAADIDANISALGSYAENLASYWQGPAHQAFETLMSDYRVYARMLHNALTDIASGLRGNFVNYSATEQSNIAQIVHVQLPAAKF